MKEKINETVNGIGCCIGIILIVILAVAIIWFGLIPMMLLGMVMNSILLMVIAAVIMLIALALAIWFIIKLVKES